MNALTLPGIEVGAWQVRSKRDPVAVAMFDRHYTRRRSGMGGEVGPPGRKLVLVTPDEAALWCTHWPKAELTWDKLDAWRCSVFRNEGPALASDLILEAMALTSRLWGEAPRDGWVTLIAAFREGFGFIGIERDPDYFAVAKARWNNQRPAQAGLL